MTRREFERIVEEAVKSLPETFRKRIENIHGVRKKRMAPTAASRGT